MEPVRLWAAVRFCAQNGSPETLLTDTAGQGLHLYGISPLPGGFCAHCAAWHYLRLAKLARQRRVRLRVQKKKGIYFFLRSRTFSYSSFYFSFYYSFYLYCTEI